MEKGEADGWPLYLRIEGNRIDQAAVRARIDSGLIQAFQKEGAALRAPIDGAKVNLLCQGPGGELRPKAAQASRVSSSEKAFFNLFQSFSVAVLGP